MRLYSSIILFLTGISLNVKGLHNIPKNGAYIICPNHSSYIDILCIYSLFPRYFVFTGKREIEKWPLFHIFFTSGMNILVDRHNQNGTISALRRMSKEIKKGIPLAIFPEGTISAKVPKLSPFKSGAFAIAIQNHIPILPVTFVTNWKLLQRSGIWKGKAGPGTADIVIHKPIITTELKKENINQLQNEVQSIINSGFN